MELQLEVGKKYRNKLNEVREIKYQKGYDTTYPFIDTEGRSYTKYGQHVIGLNSPGDLAKEVTPSTEKTDGTLAYDVKLRVGTMIDDALKQIGFDDLPESENPVVVIESPYSEENNKNIAYAKEALKDSLLRGESPMASHLLYTQTLNDNNETERNIGMEAGWQFYRHAAKCVVYADNGITLGMAEGIQIALEHGVPVEVRKLYD